MNKKIREMLGAVLLALLMSSPFIFNFQNREVRGLDDPIIAANLIASIMWVVLFFVAPFSQKKVHIALLPLYLLSAIDLFVTINFSNRLSSGYINLGLINRGEILEFLLTYGWHVVKVFVPYLIMYLCGLLLISHSRFNEEIAPPIIVLLVIFCLYFVVGSREGMGFQRGVMFALENDLSSPVGVVSQSIVASKSAYSSMATREKRSEFIFGSKNGCKECRKKTIVLVIGESSRRNNWGLFGYRKNTTPFLSSKQGVIPIGHLKAVSPSTAWAVPAMFSFSGITDWEKIESERTLVSAFSEAGYETYWFSNQAVDGWAGLIPEIANEAKQVRYFDNSHDGVVIPYLNELIMNDGSAKNKFIVIHTNGSHFKYKKRYPEDFNKFNSATSDKDRLIEEYDNSILYTDWLLKQIIEKLDSLNHQSALFYFSDHGENLYDDERNLLGHSIGTEYDLAPAAFFYTPAYWQGRNLKIISNLIKNSRKEIGASCISHSVADFAELDFAILDRKKSFFNDKFYGGNPSYMHDGKILRYEDIKAGSKIHEN